MKQWSTGVEMMDWEVTVKFRQKRIAGVRMMDREVTVGFQRSNITCARKAAKDLILVIRL